MENANFTLKTVSAGWAIAALILTASIFLNSKCEAQIQQAWVARYNNGITNGTNQAVKTALDASGNVYVTGFSQNGNTNFGYVTIKYAPTQRQPHLDSSWTATTTSS
jgi:hypothetical protein